jgi:hypothetical protein
MIVVASILCDRKRSSWEVGLPNILAQNFTQPWSFYINIESNPGLDQSASDKLKDYDDYLLKVANSGIPFAFDIWTNNSSWWQRPSYDQDQSRLTPIVQARNMALNYARAVGAYGILFVDNDVIVPPMALSVLEQSGKHLIGGLVPGRGVHRNMRYIFGETNNWEGRMQECAHGTLGCMFIHSDVFNYLSFRWGPAYRNGTMLSEDPAYCNDAKLLMGERFWIHHDVQCEHWDDPVAPLTQDGVAGF